MCFLYSHYFCVVNRLAVAKPLPAKIYKYKLKLRNSLKRVCFLPIWFGIYLYPSIIPLVNVDGVS